MSKHLKADNVWTLCGIDFSVLDYKVASVVELPEDATCEWCVSLSQDKVSDMASNDSGSTGDVTNPPKAQSAADAPREDSDDRLRHLAEELYLDGLAGYPLKSPVGRATIEKALVAIDEIVAIRNSHLIDKIISETEALKTNVGDYEEWGGEDPDYYKLQAADEMLYQVIAILERYR